MAEQQIPVGTWVLTPTGKSGTVLSAENSTYGNLMANGKVSEREWQYRVDVNGVYGASWFAEEELRVVEIRDGS